ncbi:glycosyltransferase family 2 protein [Lyngbya confervoides]|uniref:Glycosyltransferase family 2 protein n=1 Tax=Lyngbya confervoides BDU141951 TaxID=1574623 RepID=A0ABD4T690_9CYAN|nr:glycosyltransferase family 2 protein [Lyngbya confervoides]MCM1984291.1 glycosyltransferase family 2 protein [Lyngbya confervoides BDU141951]
MGDIGATGPSQKYCDRYGEPLARQFMAQGAEGCPRCYDYVLCIPVYDESPDFIAPLLNSIQADVLVILVFNAPQGSSWTQVRTEQAFRTLTQSQAPLSWIRWNYHVDVLAVDCCTSGRQLPLREGVGLARKIAGDLALVAMVHGKIASPWIYCTDADVQLPAHYFEAVSPTAMAAAALFPFVHRPLHEPILQYEIALRYYVLQLDQVKSPYAFHTIGSSMAIHAQHYAAVRGFPRREAAEDFYILNKLAKTGLILRLKTEPLVLSSRPSHRVPFGTGAALNRLRTDPIQRLYHPTTFEILGQWLRQMDRLWQERDRVQSLGLEAWWAEHPLDCEAVLPLLLQLGLAKVLKQAYRQCGDRAHFLYYLQVWFDGFRTLRFIHLLRDWGLPSVPISPLAACDSPFGSSWCWQGKSLRDICDDLARQEAQLPIQIGPRQYLQTPGQSIARG